MALTGPGNRLSSGVQVREYHLQDVVGEGGFGIVYRAHDSGLDRTVAIKEYMPSSLASRTASHQVQIRPQHKEAFDAGLRSFINEARLLAKFSHPALVHVYRFFEENGTAYMVMRYYEGQTFRSFLTDPDNGMDERWLTSMLSPILDGLEMLHTADCFHRDIAPDNVYLRPSGMPVLLDFGAARRIIGDMTQALTMVLKPGYAPIEQYADDGAMPQGAWTDIYQLGAMLYRAITGKVPPTSVARMMNDPVRMLTPTQHPGYSAQFLRGVHQALSVRPEDRPQTIAELKILLGVDSFNVAASGAWPASDSMPLDAPEWSHDATAEPGPPAPVATDYFDMGQVTTVRLTDSLINSPSSSAASMPSVPINTLPVDLTALRQQPDISLSNRAADPIAALAPVAARDDSDALKTMAWPPNGDLPKQPVAEANRRGQSLAFVPNELASEQEAEQGLWQPPVAYAASAQDRATTAPANNRFFGKLAAVVTAAVVMLAGAWLWPGAQPAPGKPLIAVGDKTRWEVAKKERTAASLQAYLALYPAGEHATEARAMLASLKQPVAPAVQAQPVVPPVAQGGASPASEAALRPEPSAPAAATANSGTSTAAKPTPAPSSRAENAGVNANAAAPPIVLRPRPEATNTGAPPAGVAENKPPAAVEMGTVVLKVTPWGNVRVNRSPVGSSPPLTQLNLPEGPHQIEISNPNGASVTKLVQVVKGEVVTLSHMFE